MTFFFFKFIELWIFLWTEDHMGIDISKRYYSYSFHPISSKLNEDIDDHTGIQTFLGNRQIKKKRSLHFEILTELVSKS